MRDQEIRHRLVVGALLPVLSALFVYGGFNQFFPSSAWESWCIGPAIISWVTLAGYVSWLLWKRHLYLPKDMASWKILCAGMFFGVIMAMLIWFGLLLGVGGVANHLIGQTRNELIPVEKHYVAGGKGCNYRLVGQGLTHRPDNWLCLSRDEFERYPPQAQLQANGMASWLGMTYSSYFLVNPEKLHP